MSSYPIPDGGPVVVLRDGKPVSDVLVDGNAAFAWILGHTSSSVDWALRYEGYSVVLAATIERRYFIRYHQAFEPARHARHWFQTATTPEAAVKALKMWLRADDLVILEVRAAEETDMKAPWLAGPSSGRRT